MSPKENLLRLLRFDNPAYIPYGLESVRPFWHRDAKFFFGNGDPNAQEWTDIWGVYWKLGTPGASETFYPVTRPLADWDALDTYTFPDPYDPAVFAQIRPLIEQLNRDTHLLMLSNPGFLFTRAWLLRGMENFLMDMVSEPQRAEDLLDRILYYQEGILTQQLAFNPDIVYFGDDVGTNLALMIRPALWREMLKPRLAKLVKRCRNAGAFVILHTCGKIEAILEDIIEVGVNVLNPVQAGVNDFRLLKKISQGRLTLFGGVDSGALVTSTPEEVRVLGKQVIGILGRGGGYIMNPDQLLPFPEENIQALREVHEQFKYVHRELMV
jgi:uroporphyrinogen decarboxylase